MDALEKDLKQAKQEICEQKKEIKEYKQKVDKMESDNKEVQEQLEHMEQESNNRTFLLTGEKLWECLHNYQNGQTKNDLHSASEHILAKKIGVEPSLFNIVECKRLGKPMSHQIDKRPLLIKVDNMIGKNTIFSQVIQGDTKGIYISEYLTKKRRGWLHSLLELRKTQTKKIKIYSKNGILRVQIEDSPVWNVYNQKSLEEIMKKMTMTTN